MKYETQSSLHSLPLTKLIATLNALINKETLTKTLKNLKIEEIVIIIERLNTYNSNEQLWQKNIELAKKVWTSILCVESINQIIAIITNKISDEERYGIIATLEEAGRQGIEARKEIK
jgi:hypothetical protein